VQAKSRTLNLSDKAVLRENEPGDKSGRLCCSDASNKGDAPRVQASHGF